VALVIIDDRGPTGEEVGVQGGNERSYGNRHV